MLQDTARSACLVYHAPRMQNARGLVSEPPLGLCARHMPRTATPDKDRGSLHRKPLRTRGSTEDRLRVNGAVRMGSQVPAGRHALQRINVRSAMPSQDGTVAEHKFERQQCCRWWRQVDAGGRRVLTRRQGEDGVRHQLALYQTYDTFCWPPASLYQPLSQPESTHGNSSAKRWQPRTPAMAASMQVKRVASGSETLV